GEEARAHPRLLRRFLAHALHLAALAEHAGDSVGLGVGKRLVGGQRLPQLLLHLGLALENPDHRQGQRPLAQVLEQRLAEDLRIGVEVERVVGELEGDAHVPAIATEGLGHLRAAAARAAAGTRRPAKERGGLALHHAPVIGLGGLHRAPQGDLQGLAGDEIAQHRDQFLQRARNTRAAGEVEGAGEEEIAREHAGGVAPQKPRSRTAPADVAFVDDVVVQKSRRVRELGGNRQRHAARASRRARRQKGQERPQALAAGDEEVLGGGPEVRRGSGAEPRESGLEPRQLVLEHAGGLKVRGDAREVAHFGHLGEMGIGFLVDRFGCLHARLASPPNFQENVKAPIAARTPPVKTGLRTGAARRLRYRRPKRRSGEKSTLPCSTKRRMSDRPSLASSTREVARAWAKRARRRSPTPPSFARSSKSSAARVSMASASSIWTSSRSRYTREIIFQTSVSASK